MPYFGKTPWKGTHSDRLTTFKGELDKLIANMQAGHNLELYAEIESMIDKNKHKNEIVINHHKKFPKASRNELNSVLYALKHKGKLMHFNISKNSTKIGLPDLKIYDEIEAIIDKNKDEDEIHIDYHKFPAASVNELYSILKTLKNNGKLVAFNLYEEQISIDLKKIDD